MKENLKNIKLDIKQADCLGNGISGNGISGNGMSGNGISNVELNTILDDIVKIDLK